MLTKESVLNARNLAIEVIQSADQLWTYQIIAVLRTTRCIREAVASIAVACAKRIELGTRFNAVLTDELVTEILTACRDDYHPSEDSPRQTFHQMADYHLDMALLVADNFLSDIASMHIGVPWDKPEFDEQMPVAAFGNRRHEAYWLAWARYASNLTGHFDPYKHKDDPINARTRGEALLATYRSGEYHAAKLVEMVKVESACVLAKLEKKLEESTQIEYQNRPRAPRETVKEWTIDEFETGPERFSDHRGNGKSYGDANPSGDITVDDPVGWFLAECELWVNTNQVIGLLSEHLGNEQLDNDKTIEEILKLRRQLCRIRNSLQSLQDEAAEVCLANSEDPKPLFNIVRASEQATGKFWTTGQMRMRY